MLCILEDLFITFFLFPCHFITIILSENNQSSKYCAIISGSVLSIQGLFPSLSRQEMLFSI